MAQPPAYAQTTDFSDYQAANPTDPINGASLDTEFQNLVTTIAAVLSNMALLQRDDGEQANASIGRDQLKPEIYMGIDTPTGWATATEYTKRNSVIEAGKWYYCGVAHTSATFSTDLAAAKWVEIFDFTTFIEDLALATTTPAAQVAGAGAIGTSTFAARADHVHPQADNAELAATSALAEAALSTAMST